MRRIALLAALGLALTLPGGWTERDVRGNDAGVLYSATSPSGRASLAVLAKPDGCAPGLWEERADAPCAAVFRVLVTERHLFFFADETPEDGDWQSIQECLEPQAAPHSYSASHPRRTASHE